MDEQSFVEEIRRSPHDITPRLIYADFLEDSGNPRGELIRVQCELNELTPGSPGRSELFDRERELLEQYADDWLRPLREMGVQGVSAHSFRGGLLECARMNISDYMQHGARLCDEAPGLCKLQLRNIVDSSSLDELSFPHQITSLDLSANRLTDEWWSGHGNFLHSETVTEVSLQTNQLGGSLAFHSIAALWPNLESLCLGSNQLIPPDFVTDGAVPAALRRLDLHRNSLGDAGFSRLLSINSLTKSLEHLNVSSCQIASLGPLSDPARLPNLQELIIRHNALMATEWYNCDARQRFWLESLRVLDTRNNRETLPVRGI